MFGSEFASVLKSRRTYVDSSSDSTYTATGTGTGKSRFAGQLMTTKSDTGFVGLANQGATCYLNSLLQTLYMTPELRAALFAWKWDGSVAEEFCLPLQLQRLFCRLQLTERGAVTTGDLTKSFGWDTGEAFVQQDVNECMSVLFDMIGRLCSGSEIARFVQEGHTGTLVDYIRCTDCGAERSHTDRYSEVAVVIKGMGTLERALEAYVTPELMFGDNKISCDACGDRRDSHKGLKFGSVPYILAIQLKRFDIDWTVMRRIKLNDKLTFPLTLDMAPYVSSDGDADGASRQPMLYVLYSVLMHTGSAMGGHYFAYTRDFATGKWMHFNDSKVTAIAPDKLAEVLGLPTAEKLPVDLTWWKYLGGRMSGDDDGSGDGDSKAEDAPKPVRSSAAGGATPRSGVPSLVHSGSNAYMLFYRRVEPGRNLDAVPDELVPEDMRERIQADNVAWREDKAAYDLEKQNIKVKIFFRGKQQIVTINETKPLSALVQLAAQSVDGGDEYALEDLRLRHYDTFKDLLLAPLEGDDKTLKSLEIVTYKPLALETKEAGSDWQPYNPDALQLNLMNLNLDSLEYEEPRLLAVPHMTVKSLRQTAADALATEPAHVRLVFLAGEEAKILSEDSMHLARDVHMNAGDTVHCEVVDSHLEGESIVVRLFQDVVNGITVRYNVPGTVGMTRKVATDVRHSLAQMKLAIAADLDMDVATFIIKRAPTSQELKDLSHPLIYYGINDDSTVFLQAGTPLEPGQFRAKLALWQPQSDDDEGKATDAGDKPAAGPEETVAEDAAKKGGPPLPPPMPPAVAPAAAAAAAAGGGPPLPPPMPPAVAPASATGGPPLPPPLPTTGGPPMAPPLPGAAAAGAAAGGPPEHAEEDKNVVMLGSTIVTGTTSWADVKAAICAEYDLGTPSKLRLRNWSRGRLTDAYPDALALADSKAMLKDGMLIVVQQLEEEETLHDGDLVITIRQWNAADMKLEDGEERVLPGSMLVGELKAQLASTTGLPVEELLLHKPFTWQLADVNTIASLKWNERGIGKLMELSKLHLAHGGTLLYADNRDIKRAEEKRDEGGALVEEPSFAASSRVREVGIKILSPEEMEERARKRAADEEQRKSDMELARQLAMDRDAMNEAAARSSADAGVPLASASGIPTPPPMPPPQPPL